MIDYPNCPKCSEKVALETDWRFEDEGTLAMVADGTCSCGYQFNGELTMENWVRIHE